MLINFLLFYGKHFSLHLIIKQKTMTSQEILQSSMLDMLFENKNKQYGAYDLRKNYDRRMFIALGICISSAMLIFYVLSMNAKTDMPVDIIPKDTVTVTYFELPEDPLLPQQQPEIARPHPAQTTASVDHQTIQIVPDREIDQINVPTTDDMSHAAVSNVNAAGAPDTGLPVPAVQGNGNAIAAEPNTSPESGIFDPVEKQPEFPGGNPAWAAFLNRYLQVPDDLQPGERRTVQVRFQVSAEGEITKFEILQSGGSIFDREVIRVLKKMPKWKPAIQNGRPIAISFVQPVTFQANEE
jgi:protein TonB